MTAHILAASEFCLAVGALAIPAAAAYMSGERWIAGLYVLALPAAFALVAFGLMIEKII
jgi:hypothetical protein